MLRPLPNLGTLRLHNDDGDDAYNDTIPTWSCLMCIVMHIITCASTSHSRSALDQTQHQHVPFTGRLNGACNHFINAYLTKEGEPLFGSVVIEADF